MIIVVGDKVIDTEKEIVTIWLTDWEKECIANMAPDDKYFLSAPSDSDVATRKSSILRAASMVQEYKNKELGKEK